MAADRWERTRVPEGPKARYWAFNARRAGVLAEFLRDGVYPRAEVARALRNYRRNNDPREVGRLWLMARKEAAHS